MAQLSVGETIAHYEIRAWLARLKLLAPDYPGWSPDRRGIDFSIARKRGDLYPLDVR